MRQFWTMFAALIALIAAPAMAENAPSAPTQTAQPAVAPGGYTYLLHLPRTYSAKDRDRWPVLIFLHGSGERGTDINLVKVHGPPQIADRDPDFPFVTISPQLPEGQSWDPAKLDAILDKALKTMNVDPSRVYLTGLSLGGFGTWDWAAARPDRFAAIAPVCGRAHLETAPTVKNIPIWAFHGDSDPVVPPSDSFDMVKAVRDAGGNPRLTIFPATGHNSWDQAYGDPALYYWLLSQHLPDSNIKDKK